MIWFLLITQLFLVYVHHSNGFSSLKFICCYYFWVCLPIVKTLNWFLFLFQALWLLLVIHLFKCSLPFFVCLSFKGTLFCWTFTESWCFNKNCRTWGKRWKKLKINFTTWSTFPLIQWIVNVVVLLLTYIFQNDRRTTIAIIAKTTWFFEAKKLDCHYMDILNTNCNYTNYNSKAKFNQP